MTRLDQVKLSELPTKNKRLDQTRLLLQEALTLFEPERVALSFSRAEYIELIDLVQSRGSRVGVFSLDTGRLHEETYQFSDTVRKHYQQPIEMLYPDPAGAQTLLKEKGLFSFCRDGHAECCGVRKVAPHEANA